MSRSGIPINSDGSTEAWDGDNYVPLGSMRVAEPPRQVMDFPPPPRLYLVIEEYPAFTIDEFSEIARSQRKQKARKRRLRELLLEAVRLASRGSGAAS